MRNNNSITVLLSFLLLILINIVFTTLALFIIIETSNDIQTMQKEIQRIEAEITEIRENVK